MRSSKQFLSVLTVIACAAVVLLPARARAQQGGVAAGAAAAASQASGVPQIAGTNDVKPPSDYAIGVDDQLSIVFWKDKDLTTDVVVRPDGMVSLPLLNDIKAAGLTPDQLRDNITQAALKYVEDPTVTIVVKQINSRKVFITGQIGKPGAYPLTGGMTVVQLIALAGGLGEYADREHITLVRGTELRPDGTPWSYQINFNDLTKRVRLNQNNLVLKPGDSIIVP
jgi:polysaccharide export outer membrane protein